MPWMKNRLNYCITLILSQFNYCSKYGCFAVKQVTNRSNKYRKWFRNIIVYNDPHMPLEELPIHDQGISLHRKQINILLTKICKHFQGEIFIF